MYRLYLFTKIYIVDDPNDQMDTLNNLLLYSINENASLKIVKLKKPPAPWMKNLHTQAL